MKKIYVLTFVAAFLFTGSLIAQNAGAPAGATKIVGETKGWPSADRYAFISECVNAAKVNMPEHQARYYCYCMQERLENRYPNIAEVTSKIETIMQSPEVQKDAKECVEGEWVEEEREEFLSNCVTEATKNIGEEKAKNYCECMLFKVEQAYPKSADAVKITGETLSSPAWKKKIQACNEF